MKLYTAGFFTITSTGNFSHNVNVAIKKSKGMYQIKWDFIKKFFDPKNKTVTIKGATSEKEAFEKFLEKEFDFVGTIADIYMFEEITF